MNSRLVSVLLVVLLAAATLATSPIIPPKTEFPGRHVVAFHPTEKAPRFWKLIAKPQNDAVVAFTVQLKQRNLDILEEKFWKVSDPSSPEYGKFMTMMEVQKLTAPSDEAIATVFKWLAESKVSNAIVKGDFIKVIATVAVTERMFQTQLHVFEHDISKINVIKHIGALSIPVELKDHIDFVSGLSEFVDNTKLKPQTSQAANDVQVTPAVLRTFYNVPATLVATNAKTTQAVIAFTDRYSAGALAQFDKYFNVNSSIVKIIGPDCLPNCDQFESDLDVQYMTAMGQNVPTWFWNHDNGYWILEYTQEVSSTTNPPLVHSISYGWSEMRQCDVATNACGHLGYNSQQYVARTDTEFQKMGVRGLTVFVSDGDDGAPSFYGTDGTCPVDGNHNCPVGGCTHTTSSCGSVLISQGTKTCYLPMGVGSDNCQQFLQDQNFQTAFGNFIQQNGACKFAVETDSRKNFHFYSTCACTTLKTVSANGYTISGYNFNPSRDKNPFNPDYPTASPYVTSVGATQFLGSGPNYNEVAASILTGAIITTGGGFAAYQSQPSYQKAAVAAYLNSGVKLPPSGTYNPANRAYPDISFNGHNYLVFSSNDNSENCPCSAGGVDGTSCSSPAIGGLFSLINDALLNAGKSPLGFLNPALYQMASASPSAFKDVTSGNNNCNRAYCCQFGYEAARGWDPVTGLGSINFANAKSYLLGLKGVQA